MIRAPVLGLAKRDEEILELIGTLWRGTPINKM